MSRSQLRRRLDTLELEAGCEILVATPSGVVLTPAGAVIAAEGRDLLERAARMLAAARAGERQTAGTIRVILPLGVPDAVRLPLLRSLIASAPALSVHEREVSDPLAHLHEPFELMFHLGPPPAHGQWFSRTLRRLKLVPLASEAYLASRGRPTSTDDLASHTLLAGAALEAIPSPGDAWAGGAVAVEPVLVSDNAQLLHRAMQAGLGILLGSADPIILSGPEPVVTVLEDQLADEDAMRLLSPLPVDVDARARTLVEGVHAFLASLEA